MLYIIIFLTACTEPHEVGINLLDDTLGVKTHEIDLIAYTVKDEPVPTNYTSSNILGYLNDPVFGQTKASIYAEFRLIDNNIILGNDPIFLDSVVLELYYGGDRYYGDYHVKQNIKVYELEENFPDGDNGFFYSDIEIDHKPTSIADTLVQPLPYDSLEFDNHVGMPHLRIRLDDEFGNKLIDDSESGHFTNNTAFLDHIKGLLITVDSLPPDEIGAILYFNLLRANEQAINSSIRLYYHYINEEGIRESTNRSFPVNEFSNRASRVEHFNFKNSHSYLQEQVNNNNISFGDSLLFIKSLGGTNVYLEFAQDAIDSLSRKENIVINMANLIIPIDQEFESKTFPPPERLYGLKYNEDGEFESTEDSNYNYFGGRLNNDKNEFRINITQYFQGIIDDPESNHGFTLFNSESHIKTNRVVLKGPGQNGDGIKLELSYTVLN